MSPTEAAKAFYHMFGTGKIAELLQQLVDADSVLDNPLPAPIPFGGQYKGPQGFAAYAQGIFASLKIERFEIDDIFAAGERVVVLGRETSCALSTGKSYTMSWVHVLTVRNGRILHLREYNDTAAMAAAFA